MAVCRICGRDPTDTNTVNCVDNKLIFYSDGVTMPAIPFGKEQGHLGNSKLSKLINGLKKIVNFDFCPDCGVKRGGYHHPWCDVEMCPRCGGRLLVCDCEDINFL